MAGLPALPAQDVSRLGGPVNIRLPAEIDRQISIG
jgi:hypothetical protein